MIRLYHGLSGAAAPLVRAWLNLRARNGREDPDRLAERLGIAGAARPAGPLIWLHGASVGEAVSALALIERLRTAQPEANVLLTSGTVSAAAILASRLPPGVLHQYVPVDVPFFVDRFLSHWRPDLALWIESELWPNLLKATRQSAASIVLVNGRMSPRSYRRWRRAPRTISHLLRQFDLCMAQSEADAARFRQLGAPRVVCHGNLKHAAPPLPCDGHALAALKNAIRRRPVWAAASTHPGEEEQIAEVHRHLRRRHPDLLTIIVPRHAARGAEVERRLGSLRLARRAEGRLPGDKTEVYLADTMGELGVIYRAVPIVFVGGSLVPHGGQNPLEPARLGCAVLHGPHMHNFAEVAAEMDSAGAAVPVASTRELSQAVGELLQDSARRLELASNASMHAASREAVLDAIMDELAPFLDTLQASEAAHARA